MAENTGIAWTDHTWNPWRGCSKALLPNGTPHPGCQHCYAERMSKRNPEQLGIWGDAGTRVRAVRKTFELPLKWDRQAAAAGRIDNVFVDSMSDFFEDREDVAPWRQEAFGIMDRCQNLNFQILTKRPGNVRRLWKDFAPTGGLMRRDNVTLCYSASNQETLHYGAPLILQCSDLCATVGISLEPMLGPVDLTLDGLCCGPCRYCVDQPPDYETNVVECRQCDSTGKGDDMMIDWVIVGCESNGPRVGRLGDFASESEWWDAAADVVRQCKEAGVPVFVKQGPIDGRVSHDMVQFASGCMRQEFPTTKEQR